MCYYVFKHIESWLRYTRDVILASGSSSGMGSIRSSSCFTMLKMLNIKCHSLTQTMSLTNQVHLPFCLHKTHEFCFFFLVWFCLFFFFTWFPDVGVVILKTNANCSWNPWISWLQILFRACKRNAEGMHEE